MFSIVHLLVYIPKYVSFYVGKKTWRILEKSVLCFLPLEEKDTGTCVFINKTIFSQRSLLHSTWCIKKNYWKQKFSFFFNHFHLYSFTLCQCSDICSETLQYQQIYWGCAKCEYNLTVVVATLDVLYTWVSFHWNTKPFTQQLSMFLP